MGRCLYTVGTSSKYMLFRAAYRASRLKQALSAYKKRMNQVRTGEGLLFSEV